MTFHKSKENCWQVFLACMLDLPVEDLAECSTEKDDWPVASRWKLAEHGLFVIEVDAASMCTEIPRDALIGGGIVGTPPNNSHCVIGRISIVPNSKEGNLAFQVKHDPSGQFKRDHFIYPDKMILLCRFDRLYE